MGSRSAGIVVALAAFAVMAAGCTAAGTHSSPASYVADPRQVRVSVASGCPATLGPARDVRNPAHGLTDALLPKAELPRGGLVCSYHPNARETMVALTSTVLPVRSAR